jgi:hypothetical protein
MALVSSLTQSQGQVQARVATQPTTKAMLKAAALTGGGARIGVPLRVSRPWLHVPWQMMMPHARWAPATALHWLRSCSTRWASGAYWGWISHLQQCATPTCLSLLSTQCLSMQPWCGSPFSAIWADPERLHDWACLSLLPDGRAASAAQQSTMHESDNRVPAATLRQGTWMQKAGCRIPTHLIDSLYIQFMFGLCSDVQCCWPYGACSAVVVFIMILNLLPNNAVLTTAPLEGVGTQSLLTGSMEYGSWLG